MEPEQEDSVVLSSFEVNRMKAIAVAIKEGADAQRESHEKQVARLEVRQDTVVLLFTSHQFHTAFCKYELWQTDSAL